jgi:very-short-patch-repair endonuclease
MELKRPSASIREMVSNMPASFATLAPCVLMSPLSIAQYLPAGQQLFDVVIFDEASQITTWDAIGAIARGRQTIIVGDPKQLPPTSFFSRTDSEQDSEELEEYERDLESILDEARASGLPTLQLTWHYRSQHESLIAFSNWHYYDNQLITFPSVATQDQAVQLRYIDTGVFDRGGSRTNRVEADALTAEAVARMQTWLTLPEDQRPTLGVITFNQPQQKLIEDLFDRARTAHPELEWFFDDARTAPTIVKNLENVQGDERDVILFSIAFGFDQTGRFTRNFGALNRDGGQRRLNVAVTRARQEMIVFTSFRAEHLSIEGVQHQGVVHLKNFLDYAERGTKALPAMDRGSVGSHDSPFEEAVAERLRAKGWEVVPQIGVSRFRIDLGVINPDAPGAYLAGIECDGATYHSSATARDRDVVREHILRNLGWNIIRIWSPEWWHDSERETEEVHKKLTSLLTNYRTQHPPSPLPGDRGRG